MYCYFSKTPHISLQNRFIFVSIKVTTLSNHCGQINKIMPHSLIINKQGSKLTFKPTCKI